MSDEIKKLREEVQYLRDELAKMKRHYEDILYNLDYDNFSSQLIKEKDGMKAEITLTAEGLSSKVSKDDFAEYSEISQTAKAISTLVSKNVNLSEAVRVNNKASMTDGGKLYYIQDGSVKTYYYYDDTSRAWEVLSGDSINSVFEQTANGFKFKGGVRIDGNQVVLGNLTLGGNITWDLSNSPVQTRYSVSGNANNNNDWHPSYTEGDLFMQMSFDGGSTWSTPTKIVGTDGSNGTNGNDADVTPQNVFNALTDSGANQGIFAIFDKVGEQGSEQLFINAEYIQGRIGVVKDELHVGDSDVYEYDENTQAYKPKSIIFGNTARISGIQNGGTTKISISASALQLGDRVTVGDNANDANLVATRGWVLNNAERTAVFG